MWEQALVGGIAIWVANGLAKEAVAITMTDMGWFLRAVLSTVVMAQAIVTGLAGYILLLYSLYMYMRAIF